ncbi:hypothetical protein ANCCEY_13590 [Ancylostoma ceylanicum]|uniref:WD domain, G-beta repeat protein n=1 Tax=Ancylostoma ceylanicum TaxID=53326 RepID=A0A0D6LBX5_9BILA|nr:hypothetical protein ANCCEY_13590 [Ancylostoma ceylanicum]
MCTIDGEHEVNGLGTLDIGSDDEKSSHTGGVFQNGQDSNAPTPVIRAGKCAASSQLNNYRTYVRVGNPEPLICKKIAHERLTVLEFRKDCLVTACQEGFICTWARPGKVPANLVKREVSSPNTMSSPTGFRDGVSLVGWGNVASAQALS